MSLKLVLAALAAATPIALAAPGIDTTARSTGLRLIKTSPTDPGTWMSDEERFDRFTSQHMGYFDITDLKDEEFLSAISVSDSERVTLLAAEFPKELKHIDEAKGFISKSSTDAPVKWMDKMTSFHTRQHKTKSGIDAANWLTEEVKKAAGSNKAITVEQFKHGRFEQRSTIARIPGKTDNLVIIGAHLDSTVRNPNDRSPGADDNASGSVTIMEALRVLAESGFAPQNTIEFHWYAAEEAGLLGSAEIFRKYKSDGKKVTSYLNQDMTGYSPSGTPALITDFTDAGLTDFMELVITEYTGKKPNRGRCGYACSDHASATANGFPSAFAFEDLFDSASPHVHTINDTPANLQFETVQKHIALSIGYLTEASYI